MQRALNHHPMAKPEPEEAEPVVLVKPEFIRVVVRDMVVDVSRIDESVRQYRREKS